MQMVWDKIAARKAKLDQETTQRDTESSAFAMREAIAKLRLTQSPVEFWLAMMNEQPRGASAEQRAAHMLFCKSAAVLTFRALWATHAEWSAQARLTSRCSDPCGRQWIR